MQRRHPNGTPRRPRLALLLAAAGVIAALPARAARAELHLLQPDGQPLAGAVFYALPLDGRRLPPPAAAVMDQRDRRFVPQVLAVQTGAVVSFPNTDSISHHVYSFSAPKRFELYLPKKEHNQGEHGAQVTFDRPGVVAIGCNIHDWMLAYILVVDTPWFGQTDAHGQAVLADLPAGRYRLVVWHPRVGDREPELQREVRLEAEGTDSWPLRLRAPLLPSRDQEPGFKDYR